MFILGAELPHSIEHVISSHQVELQSWLNEFNQFLPRTGVPTGECGHGRREEPTWAEYEALWEVINEDDAMMTSLECIHGALVRCWGGGCGTGSTGFNPQGIYNHKPTMEAVDNINWKGMVCVS